MIVTSELRLFRSISSHKVRDLFHELSVSWMFRRYGLETAFRLLQWAFDQPKPESVREFLRSPMKGAEQTVAQADEFYSVTLSGNGERIVVRHWMQMTVEAARQNLCRWLAAVQRRFLSRKTADNTGERSAGSARDPS